MLRALKTVRTVQWMMLASIVLYVIVAEVVAPSMRPVKPSLGYLFATIAVTIVGLIFVVRRTLVLRAEESLATRPDDSLSLSHWRTGHIMTYVLCEILALFGFALRFLGGNLQQSLPFYIGGFVLLLFFRPRPPVRASST